ncbi:type IX secretion system sortase PorU [Nonlabens ulvanivorans]|uniref:Flagellar hook capping protein, Fjo24 n=4 Tax=Nonlabens ulvanivorans TaxID=906888 RepID=A0A084JSS3_NONUL|nr:flagellar hook capping protein, Fjo24 [Nonlabens ulvanivorans]
MRYIFLIIVSFPLLLMAQGQKEELKWQPALKQSIGDYTVLVPYFENGYQFNGSQIWFSKSIETSSLVNESSLVLENLQTEVLSNSELADLDKEFIVDGLQYSLRNALSRKRNYAQIRVSPIFKDGNQYRKVVSFTPFFTDGEPIFTTKSTNYGNSLLTSGEWFRFKVENTGVHRITRSFLSGLGINVSDIDPRTIKVYGNGGPSLPLVNSQTVAYDPAEIAISVRGENDGSFDSGDEILFYATAANSEYILENDSHINPYTDESFYYITISSGNGKRILPFVQPMGTPAITYDYFHARQHHEIDERNIGQIGRIWYGERFDFEPEQTFEFEFNNVIGSRPASLKVVTGAISDIGSSFTCEVNGVSAGTIGHFGLAGVNTLVSRRGQLIANNINVTSDDVDVKITFENSGNPGAEGYLDYIELEVPQSLVGIGESYRFRNTEAALQPGVVQFQFSNATSISEVWNISDPYNVTTVLNNTSDANFSFVDNGGEVKEYIVVDNNDFFNPISVSNRRVANQNLKGTIFIDSNGNFKDIDYLIITPSFLESEAQRLANYHITSSNLNTKVVTLSDIYNEFSEGEQDIAAIRNFVKYVYDNASSPANRVKYLNMFGDASFDYKNRISVRENIVPSFLTAEATSLTQSYVTDDFFTYMNPNEGNVATNNLMDLAVGRMIVTDITEAREMVDKVVSYTAQPAFERWRNDVVLIGDDIDDPQTDSNLQVNVNDLADQIELNRPDYNVRKIMMDSYQQLSTAGGFRYPDVEEAVKNAFERGSLVINYFGHGNEDGLAQEFIVTQSSVENLRNPNNLPLFITVTCEFTRFDNPLRPSGGEKVYLNPDGGAIGLVATNRLIFISTGVTLNRTLDQYLFSYNNAQAISMAESLRLAKVDPALNNDATRRVVAFIGDPALKLAIPDPNVVLTAVNGNPIASNTDVLRALDPVVLSGEVHDLQGNLIPNYNGEVSVTVFDKEIDRTTLGNDDARDSTGQLILLDFKQQGEVLFRGQATVTNGVFDVNFVMPLDTQVPIGNGRISFYAKRDGVQEDKNGYNLDVRIGGVNTAAPADDIGPEIDLYMNDTNFVNGGITDENPFILAFLSDDNGINTSSGIGHDITATLDGNDVDPFILNDYYEADVDNFARGQVYFPLRDLEPGLHTLKLKAWDTYNNSAEQEIQFIVAENDGIKLERVLNYPNPFTTYTEFWFNHNKPFEPLNVQIQVMTISGKVIWSKNQSVTTTGFTSREITWDGTDDFGQRLGKGVYIYKITVKSTLSNQQTSKVEKLVIL